MIFHRLGLMNKNQMGFTLIEMIIVLAIAGIVIGATTMVIFQVINGSSHTSNHMTAVRQVQSAGYWVSRDTQMAKTVEPALDPDPDGFPLTLTWTDRYGDDHQVVYTLLADNKLQRSHSNGTTETGIMAEFIDPDPTKTSCVWDVGVLTFTVTATVQEQSETRVYEVVPRPGS